MHPGLLAPAEPASVQPWRRAGIGLLGAGGVVAGTGFGLTLAYTILGDRRQGAEDPVLADIEELDASARVGGALLAAGIAIVAVGGIIFVISKKKAGPRSGARIRLAPTFGGLVVSGQF
ncbi:hypothetical protein [Enhygromyxa salina]|uniref:hypothetical protein n=1 Tax=Enhygromyxa salina TaxID=215803 RepID=UPI0015E5BE7B|nr:hypothetical protein [Enhygromyxa salina]